MPRCKSIECEGIVVTDKDFCGYCENKHSQEGKKQVTSLSEKYPQYYKPVGKLTEVDVYAVHHLFDIQDPSGAIQHASKKLLLSGVRTGGKSAKDDIREARDTLNRWLELTELMV